MICSAFWNHTNIRQDNIFACCRYKTSVAKFTGDIEAILHLPEYKKIREDNLNGVINPNCQKCYYEESIGKKSLREQFNEEYNINEVSLKFLELGLDNICNLTCDGCGPEFSSSWAKKLDVVFPISSKVNVTEIPPTVSKMVFLGGEPLMTKRHFKLLQNADRKKLNVIYHTNGTFLLDDDTISLLNECCSVHFILSLDGYAELNETVRKGSNWQQILKFISQILRLKFNLTVHSVIHKNNWHGIPQLENFIKSNRLDWTTNILTYPKYLDIATIENKVSIIDTISNSDIPDKQSILRHLNDNINT